MFNSKFNGALTALLVVAIVGILALIGYFGWSVYNKYYIETSAKDAVNAFDTIVSQPKNETPTGPADVENRGVLGALDTNGSLYQNQSGSTGSGKKNKYGGYEVLGTISIPKINIEYPILEKATPNAIKIAVGYSAGVGINKVGNTVISGHNYRNSLFFSNLKKLSNGDKIYIKDTSGSKITYEVYNVFEAEATDASFYNRDTAGLREITLSTCTDDGKLRTIVLAKEVK